MNPSGGRITVDLILNDSQFKAAAASAENETGNFANKAVDATSVAQKGFETLAKVGIASVAAAAVATGLAIVKNIGNAVERVDTLNNFPRVLHAMGVSGEEAINATKKLADNLKGLPTPLQEGAAGVQRFIAAGLPAGRATDLFLAMNNALIAAGSNAQDTQVTMDGMVRAISSGEVPTSTLVAMLSRMPTVMAGLTKITGKTQDELQALFEKNPQLLIDNLIKLNKEGGGGMASLDAQARQATDGIGTAFANMNTAITRGLANVIQAIGSTNIADIIAGIGNAFETGFKGIVSFINLLKENQVLLGAFEGAIAAFGVAVVVAMAIASPAVAAFAGAVGAAVVTAAPFLAIGAAIGAVAIVIQKNWSKIEPLIKGVANVFKLITTGDFKGGIFGIQEDSPVVDLLIKLHDVGKAVASFFGTQFKSIFQSIADIGKQLQPSLQPLVDFFKELIKNKAVQNILKVVALAIATLTVGPAVAALLLFAGILKVLAVVLGFVADHIEIFKKIVLTIAAVALAPLIIAVGAAIIAFKGFINFIGQVIDVVKVVGKVFGAVFGFIADIVGTAFSAVMAVWNAVLKPVFDAIIFILGSLFKIWATIWGAIFEIAFTIISTVAQIIFVIFQGVFNFLVDKILTPLAQFFATTFNAIWGVITTVFTAVWGFIVSTWNAIYGFIAPIVGAIFNVIASVFNAIWGTITNIVSSILNFVRGNFNALAGIVGGAVNSALNTVRGIAGSFIDAGRNIINGIVNGISAGSGAVVEKIKQICQDALGAVKRFFGIHSPSAVMASMGGFLMQGFAKGIDRTGVIAVDAVNSISRNILGTLGSINGTGLDIGGNLGGVAPAGQATAAAPVVQNNTINTQVDLDAVTRELAWRTRR